MLTTSPEFKANAHHALADAGLQKALAFSKPQFMARRTAAVANLPEFERLRSSVVGIAVDSSWSHAAFAAEKSITFPLLSDDAPAGGVARAFGVYSSASGRSERALFVLDPSGTVVWSGTFPESVNPGVDAVLSALEAIGHVPN